MKKNKKIICLSKKKALIVGLITAIIVTLPVSYILSEMAIAAKNAKVIDVAILLAPVLFIGILISILAVVAFSSEKNYK